MGLRKDVWIFPAKMHAGVLTQWFVVVLGMTPAEHFCRALPFPWIQVAPGTDKASAHHSTAGLQGINREEKGEKRQIKDISILLYI